MVKETSEGVHKVEGGCSPNGWDVVFGNCAGCGRRGRRNHGGRLGAGEDGHWCRCAGKGCE
jgi:hypothetical protein